jgi:hypothetical protein
MRSGEGTGKQETGVPTWARWMEAIAQKLSLRDRPIRMEEDGRGTIPDILEGLPAGFFVYNDFDAGEGRIDHILVGTKGIFLLKVQTHRGTVSIFGDQIFRDGRSRDKDLIRQVRDESWTLQQMLAKKGIASLRPLPVIVYTHAVVGIHGTIKGLEVMQRNALPDFMKRRKDVISARDAEGIFEFLKIGQADSPI